MPDSSPARRSQAFPVGRRCLAGVAVLALLGALAGCATTRFDPSSPCTADARVAGAYPQLETLLPSSFRGRPPDRVDSGRSCTPAALGSLTGHDVTELRFAGATWDLGSGSGVTLAILDAPGIQASWVDEFYETGARAAKNTTNVVVAAIDLPNGTRATRLDTLNDESFQSVVAWQDAGRVRVALVASFIREVKTREAHDVTVADALAASLSTATLARPPSLIARP
jgi:hypothetical protein